MRKSNWAEKHLVTSERICKIHNPIIHAKTFDLKVPMTWCANEDCKYKNCEACPAGKLKETCPNRSSLDYAYGCQYYIGKPYQGKVISDSICGRFQIITVITGRGTGKSSVLDTQKVIMESTTEPYVRAYLYRSSKPIPVKIVVVGNTKDTSLLLRQSIHAAFESSDELYSFVSDDTKTYMSTNNGLCEIFFKTAGVDGRGIRGFHAEIIKNAEKLNVKCTIIFIFDEGMYTRAPNVISEVMRPSLQVGNTFSQIFVTSTPHGDKGEISDIRRTPTEIQSDYNFASYHNRFTNLQLLHDFRQKMEAAGESAIYNREVLGREEADDGLYWPFALWVRSIDDSIDWMEFDEIERYVDGAVGLPIPGKYFCGVDPNKFRQLKGGDFAAFHIVQVTPDRSRGRAISYGKYLMDLEDKFTERMEIINHVFRPVFCVDGNSGYAITLRNKGYDVRTCTNERHKMNIAMRLWKQDILDGIYKQPSSQEWEDERQCFIPKEDGVSNIPILDHKGNWGSGASSDLMRCGGYIYQGIIMEFGIGGLDFGYVGSLSDTDSGGVVKVARSNPTFENAIRSSNSRYTRTKR